MTRWSYVSCKAKNKEDRYVKIIYQNKEGNKKVIFKKFNKSDFKEVDGKIYQIRKDKSGNELLSETFGFENVVVKTFKNKEGKDVEVVKMTTFTKEEVELYNRMAEAFGDIKKEDK